MQNIILWKKKIWPSISNLSQSWLVANQLFLESCRCKEIPRRPSSRA